MRKLGRRLECGDPSLLWSIAVVAGEIELCDAGVVV
jgi:hypothetical protein